MSDELVPGKRLEAKGVGRVKFTSSRASSEIFGTAITEISSVEVNLKRLKIKSKKR